MSEYLAAYSDFRSAAAAVMEYLHRRIGFDLWMVTRVEGEEWIILQVEDHGYGVQPGTVFRWADTFCIEMVRGNGPHIAPRSECVEAYTHAALGKVAKIGSYLGYPLMREDGTLFGTLCAVHPAPQPSQIVTEQPLVEMCSRMLASILNAELKTLDGSRREERLAANQFRDELTQLYDRRAWEQLLTAEEARCATYGHPACVMVIVVRLDGSPVAPSAPPAGGGFDNVVLFRAAEADLRRTAGAISSATRANDVVARVGERQFAVLAGECDKTGSRALLGRLNDALSTEGIAANVALAHRRPPLTLMHAWSEATNEAAEARGEARIEHRRTGGRRTSHIYSVTSVSPIERGRRGFDQARRV